MRAAGELQNATLFSFEGGLADGEGVLIKNSHANDKWLHEAFGGIAMVQLLHTQCTATRHLMPAAVQVATELQSTALLP